MPVFRGRLPFLVMFAVSERAPSRGNSQPDHKGNGDAGISLR